MRRLALALALLVGAPSSTAARSVTIGTAGGDRNCLPFTSSPDVTDVTGCQQVFGGSLRTTQHAAGIHTLSLSDDEPRRRRAVGEPRERRHRPRDGDPPRAARRPVRGPDVRGATTDPACGRAHDSTISAVPNDAADDLRLVTRLDHVTVNAVPEPAPAALVAAGLLALGTAARRRA